MNDIININDSNMSKIIFKYKYKYDDKEIIDDIHYCGEIDKNNQPNGYGIGIFKQSKFCGLWINGEPNGDGIKYFTQDNNKKEIKIIGKFKGLHPVGKITIYLNNILFYNGFIQNNYFEGIGKMYYPNGKLKYEGKFKNSLYDGYGRYYNDIGNIIYIGNYKANKRTGNGKLYDLKFNSIIPKYEGEWLNNKYNGNGTLYFTTTNFYRGKFINNEMNGCGKLYSNNSLYEGNFSNNKKNGNGKLTVFSGKSKYISIIYEGNFNDDELNGFVKCKYRNGDTYEGNIINYNKNGFGTYLCVKTNIKYEGEWKDDLKDGNILITDNGNYFKTIWRKGKKINNKRNIKEFIEEEKIIKKIKKNIPFEYKCPITLVLMKNPVIASDGNTYELSSLEKLFKTNEITTSPLTREILNKNVLIPNKNIRKLINDLLIEDASILHL